jgi:predicted ATPase
MPSARRRPPAFLNQSGYLRSVSLKPKAGAGDEEFPWSIPAIRNLGTLQFHPKVTYLVGENGTGKSTLLEGIADVAGFPAQGGSKHFASFSEPNWSQLGSALQLIRNATRERDGFFLRAEAFFNVSNQIEEMWRVDPKAYAPYGGISPHERSHGEAFLMLMSTRFVGRGLYILDEPEAALSPSRQLSFLAALHNLVAKRASQFLIATHGPILMAYPDSFIYLMTDKGIGRVAYEETEHFQLVRDFLNDRETYFKHLFSDEEP